MFAFLNCSGLTELTVPGMLSNVEYTAFEGCDNITNMTITSDIGKTIYAEGQEEYWDEESGEYKQRTYQYEAGYEYSYLHGIIANIHSLKHITIADGVTEIGRNAFYDCANITDIDIPDSMTTIGSCAFYGCTGLTGSFAVPEGSKAIAYNTFHDCTGLTEITIPDSVTTISSAAFYGCTGLTEIIIPDSVTSIGDSAFSGCTGLTGISISGNVTEIGENTFSGCTGLQEIVLPNSVQYIRTTAFKGCTALTNATLPGDKIYTYVYRDCGSYNRWGKWKSNWQWIWEVTQYSSLFADSQKLTNITVADGATLIYDKSFYKFKQMKTITIPETVTQIGQKAFSYCTGLKTIDIPDNVQTIGSYTFYKCTNLNSIKLPGGLTAIAADVFYGCKGLKAIEIPNNVKSVGSEAFSGCTGLTEISLPNSVTSIGNNAFNGCTNLTKITIPYSVKKFGTDVFAGCDNLTIRTYEYSDAESYAYENNIPLDTLYMLENNSVISADKIKLGETVTVNADAYGGAGDYTYAVLYKKKTESKWTTKQNYSENTTVIIKPVKAVEYDICIKVMDGLGTVTKKFLSFTVEDTALKNTSVISADTIKKGESVTIQCSAENGAEGYTYAVLYKKKSESKWTTRQGYKDNTEVIVKPYTNTEYDICVKVKDAEGTIAKKYFTVNVTA